jgi:hypothetical protein
MIARLFGFLFGRRRKAEPVPHFERLALSRAITLSKR